MTWRLPAARPPARRPAGVSDQGEADEEANIRFEVGDEWVCPDEGIHEDDSQGETNVVFLVRVRRQAMGGLVPGAVAAPDW